MPFGVNRITGRPGPAPRPPRDGDRKQARQRVNVEVRTGRRPHPNTLPCVDCGHVWHEGDKRHEYDHYLGYAAEHHLDVEPVCTVCHRARADRRAESVQIRGERGRFVAHSGTASITKLDGRRRKTTDARTRDDQPSDELVEWITHMLRAKSEILVPVGDDDPLFWRRAAWRAAKAAGRHIQTVYVAHQKLFSAFVDDLTEDELDQQRAAVTAALDGHRRSALKDRHGA